MSESGKARVETRDVPLADLLPREDRCGELSPRVRRALGRPLAAGRPYPAIIVRPHPRQAGRFEILDGHARAELLREAGATAARCEVWPVADEEADVLALALNHLRCRPSAKRRALAVQPIAARLGESLAAEALGLTVPGLRQWLRPLERPAAAKAAPSLDLRAMVFHVTAAEAAAIEGTLGRWGRGCNGRGSALARAVAGARRQASDGAGRDVGWREHVNLPKEPKRIRRS